jgi:hypothetical protein
VLDKKICKESNLPLTACASFQNETANDIVRLSKLFAPTLSEMKFISDPSPFLSFIFIKNNALKHTITMKKVVDFLCLIVYSLLLLFCAIHNIIGSYEYCGISP